jgi:TDG/mug DNA glycosylase family protein
MSEHEKLPDVLKSGLDVVFVGTAAGKRSAAERAYYAHPGNRFWRTLREIGLTPRVYKPSEYPTLPELGIGFTDLCKVQAGMDHEIDAFDIKRFEQEIKRYQPRAIAFTSKKGASIWLNVSTHELEYGEQPYKDGFPAVFVLSSPSGAAGSHWRIEPWQQLADWVRAQRA